LGTKPIASLPAVSTIPVLSSVALMCAPASTVACRTPRVAISMLACVPSEARSSEYDVE
jgi:hypothetical protein